jgi:uncharacterized protein
MTSVFEGEQGVWFRRAALSVLVLLGLFLAAKSLAEIAQFRYIGSGIAPMNLVTVSGEGEVLMVPDTAEFTFSVVERKASVAAAQEAAAQKINEIIPYLKGAGVDEKNIKTVGYNVYPQYEWQQAACTTISCPPGRQILNGYEVRQTVTVEVSDTAKAGELLSGVGELGASEVSSLTFTVEDDEVLRDDARAQAIADAKEKADSLAEELGVKLVRIVSFNESNGGYPPMPYYGDMGRGGVGLEAAKTAPMLPMGENKVISNVSITYEIR